MMGRFLFYPDRPFDGMSFDPKKFRYGLIADIRAARCDVGSVPQGDIVHTPITNSMPRGRTLGSSPAPSSTFASNGDTARAKLVKLASKAHIFDTGAPDVGADGKDYRANSVHAPFPDKSQHAERPLRPQGP